MSKKKIKPLTEGECHELIRAIYSGLLRDYQIDADLWMDSEIEKWVSIDCKADDIKTGYSMPLKQYRMNPEENTQRIIEGLAQVIQVKQEKVEMTPEQAKDIIRTYINGTPLYVTRSNFTLQLIAMNYANKEKTALLVEGMDMDTMQTYTFEVSDAGEIVEVLTE